MTSSSKTKCLLPNNQLPHSYHAHNLAPQIFTFSLELTSIPSIPSMTNEVLRIFKKPYYVKYALSMISKVHIYVF